MEVRSLPDLELVKKTSLMSILRWNFKANMEKTMSSTENGLICLSNAPGILGGIVKGFKGGKVNNTMDLAANSKLNFSQLEAIFSRNPFSEPVATITDDQKTVLELNIDDIHIDDEPVSAPSTSSHKVQKKKGTEREQLFDGEVADAKPRLRTREEIIATYRKAGDASSVAGQARDKLVERQEKLERISRQTEELQSGAEDFASLANELVKAMEGRKWWHI